VKEIGKVDGVSATAIFFLTFSGEVFFATDAVLSAAEGEHRELRANIPFFLSLWARRHLWQRKIQAKKDNAYQPGKRIAEMAKSRLK
jgi:hypothetical protein